MGKKLTAYERERNRIKRLDVNSKNRVYSMFKQTYQPCDRLKQKVLQVKALRAYVNKLKKIDVETLKTEANIPHEEDIAFSNFDDEFLSKYGSFTPEEEDFFYGLENATDEEIEQERKRREEYKKVASDFSSALRKPVDMNRSRRKEAISYSKSMQSFLLNMITDIGTSEVGRRLVEASRAMDDIDVIVSAVLWGSSVAVINQATDELLQIINGSQLTFAEKVQAESMNETENGW